MRRNRLALLLAALLLLAVPAGAGAHPEGGDELADFEHFEGSAGGSSHGNADLASPNMLHVANVPNPGVTNSDLAFWQGGAIRGPHHDIAVAGNYNGFRIFDVKDPENPVLVTDFRCRANQGDVSLYQAGNRLLLIQSVDRPVTTDNCATAVDTPVAFGAPLPSPPFPPGATRNLFQPGFEGLRIFDITNPETPVHIDSVATACGSHTHTTIPDRRDQRAIIYVSSYPTGASVTPGNADFGGPRCIPPHAKISIVQIDDKTLDATLLREQPLDADTLPFLGTIGSGGTGAVGCHDITVYYDNNSVAGSENPKPQTAGAACLEEGQLWDVSDPANPTTTGAHSHIRNLFITAGVPGTFKGLFHTASFTWDGEVVLFTDEWAGGGGHGCDGPQDTRGNVWFYDNVPPGTEVVPLYGRYMFPRPQPAQEACTLHNGNVIPTNEGYYGVSAAYEGGTSVYDFTGVAGNTPIVDPLPGEPGEPVPPLVGREIAFFDAQGVDGRGRDDVWSSYWHNDYIYANGGLGRPLNPGGRGFDVYKLLGLGGRLVDADGNPTVTTANWQEAQQYRARKFRYQNPQTQETFQTVKGASQGG